MPHAADFAVCRSLHPLPALRAALIRFAVQPRHKAGEVYRAPQLRRITLTSSGLIRSGAVQPFRSYSAMHAATCDFH